MSLQTSPRTCDDTLAGALEQLDARGLRRRPREIDGPTGPRGSIDGREVIQLCGNDYLGLAGDPRLAEAAKTAIEEGGVGSGASRLISGSRPIHRELEEMLAAFKRTEAALTFGSGYLANVGVISALVSAGDAVFSDALNHASLIDGCRLSGAAIHVYPHGDMGALSSQLRTERKARRRLIVTDGVFSMDGDLAPLPGLCRLAEAHGAWVLVDDAHGTGVIGPDGRGTAAELKVGDQVHFQVGTFSKALGGYGAFVAASRTAIDYLVNHARSFIFSTAPPAAQAAAAIAALRIVRTEPERRDELRRLVTGMRKGLRGLGFNVPAGETPIIPVRIGSAEQTMRMSELLLEEGVFVQGIRPPTVPQGTSRLRVTVAATHTKDDLKTALRAFEVAGKLAGVIH